MRQRNAQAARADVAREEHSFAARLRRFHRRAILQSLAASDFGRSGRGDEAGRTHAAASARPCECAVVVWLRAADEGRAERDSGGWFGSEFGFLPPAAFASASAGAGFDG